MPHTGALLVADQVHRYGAGSFTKVFTNRLHEQRHVLNGALEHQGHGLDAQLKPYSDNLAEDSDAARWRCAES